MTLYSNRRQPMFEIVEDTVGRHDMLYACCDPVRYEQLEAPGHANCREALTDALKDYGIGYDRIPTPINWFMNVSIQQRGELEIREPLAEAGDYVLLKAVKDAVAAVSACPQDLSATNASNPTDLRVAVLREAPLPVTVEPHVAAEPVAAAAGVESAPGAAIADEPSAPDDLRDERAQRRAERRAQRRAAAAADKEAEPETEPETGAPFVPAASARPARLRDTAEATVTRIEPGSSETGA
jgi:hypothetical protein